MLDSPEGQNEKNFLVPVAFAKVWIKSVNIFIIATNCTEQFLGYANKSLCPINCWKSLVMHCVSILHFTRWKQATLSALKPLHLQALVKPDLTLTLMDPFPLVRNQYCSADFNEEQVTMSCQVLVMLLKGIQAEMGWWKGKGEEE